MRLEADWLASPPLRAVVEALGESAAFFVGGCVRNTLLGQPVADIDLTTPLKPAEVTKRLEAANLKAVPTGIEHGTITAGTSSPLTDGASAMILMREDKAGALGYEPLGFIRSYAFAAVDPGWQMLQAPPYAAPIALKRAGLTLADMDLVDMHEAFAAQAIQNVREAGVPEEKVNICGGAIAIGHPIGASGARVLTTLLHQMERTDAKRGLAALCLGGGNAVAMIVER